MSRRYGRKQRRAARDQIELLQHSLDTTMSGLTSHRIALRTVQDCFDDLKQRIVEWDYDIRSMLGPYTSFAIDDVTYRVDHPDQIRQMPIMPPLSPLFGVSMDHVSDSVSYYVERVLHLVSSLDETDMMTLRRYLSLQIKCGSDREGSSYLAMSESYWHHLMRNDGIGRARAIRRIAEDLLRVLAQPKKKPKPVNGDDLVPAMDRQSRRI